MRPGPAARPTEAPPGHRLGGILVLSCVCPAYQDAAHWRRAHAPPRPSELAHGLDEIRKRLPLPAVPIEVCRRQPLLVGALQGRPFAVDDREPGGVAIAVLINHGLAKQALVLKTQAQGRGP